MNKVYGLLFLFLVSVAYAKNLGDGGGSGYPAEIDTATTLETSGAKAYYYKINDLYDAHIKEQTELGTNPRGGYSSVAARFNAIPSSTTIANIANSTTTLSLQLGTTAQQLTNTILQLNTTGQALSSEITNRTNADTTLTTQINSTGTALTNFVNNVSGSTNTNHTLYLSSFNTIDGNMNTKLATSVHNSSMAVIENQYVTKVSTGNIYSWDINTNNISKQSDEFWVRGSTTVSDHAIYRVNINGINNIVHVNPGIWSTGADPCEASVTIYITSFTISTNNHAGGFNWQAIVR